MKKFLVLILIMIFSFSPLFGQDFLPPLEGDQSTFIPSRVDDDRDLGYYWEPATGDVLGYNFYLSADDGPFQLVGKTLTTNCTIVSCMGYKYIAKVEAYDADGNTGPPSEESDFTILIADVNGDNIVNTFDAVLVSREVLHKNNPPLTEVQKKIGDVDGNGILNSYDAVLISQYVLKKIDHFPIRDLIESGEFQAAPGAAVRVEAVMLVREDALGQNYPNPFNPETWIPYQVSEAVEVEIIIHSMAGGNPVRILKLGPKEPGYYIEKDKAAYWDGRNEAGESVASGVYFYTILAGKYYHTKKMVILR